METMIKPEIGIKENDLSKIVDLLSSVLSDEMVLYVKTRKFHWNVTGESFMELHKLFQAQYTELEETIDEVAERISKVGGKAIGTMKEFSQMTRIKESPGIYPSQKAMIQELLQDHEAMATQLRKDIDICTEKIKDVGTTDFLTKVIQQHETNAWVLRRYLG